VVVLGYPLFRASGLVPVEDINRFTREHFDTDRSGSLAMRLEQEGDVMQRTLDRVVFGWGGYARPFKHDPWSGDNVTIIDGFWIILLSGQGAVGYVALFGMLLLPVWRARRTIVSLPAPRDRALVACLAVMAVVYAIDLIPNSSIDPYLTFLVGVLAGTEHGLAPAPSVPLEAVPA
jgi:hypothetical protein